MTDKNKNNQGSPSRPIKQGGQVNESNNRGSRKSGSVNDAFPGSKPISKGGKGSKG